MLRSRPVWATGALGIALWFVPQFEGIFTKPYLDPVSIPTVCVGHTGNVDMGRVYTDQECDALLRADLGKAFEAVDRQIRRPIPEATRAALASFTFNVGEGSLNRSMLRRRLNAGENAPACDELMKWVYAGGRVLPGLVKRRAAERELCREGFTPTPLARP